MLINGSKVSIDVDHPGQLGLGGSGRKRKTMMKKRSERELVKSVIEASLE